MKRHAQREPTGRRWSIAARAGWALLACLAGAFGARAEERRPVAPEDLVLIRDVGEVQIAPDGGRVAFVVKEPGDPKKPERERDTNIWVVPADGSAPPRLFASSLRSDTAPRWSTDGRLLAFLSSRGEAQGEGADAKPKNQIYLMRTDGGEAEGLTAGPGEVTGLKWSKDGSMIAYTAVDAPSEGEEKRRKEGDDALHVDHDIKFARLWVVRLSDRKAEQVTKQDFNVNDFSWSPDGAELALSVSPSPKLDDVYFHGALVVVRRQTGEVVRRLSDRLADFSALRSWSPDGKTILFSQSTPNQIASLPALAPAGGGGARTLLDDYRGTTYHYEWMPDSKGLISEAIEGTRARLVRIDAASGAITSLGDLFADVSEAGFSPSADGRTIAYRGEGPDSPGDVWVLPAGKPARRLTDLNPPIRSLRLGGFKEITWKNSKDGQAIYGVLVTPPDFKAGQAYPTVVQPHGGPEWAFWLGWNSQPQLLASNGYVVLLPNPRGSDGQGWRFVEANRDDWGGMDFRDIMDGVDDLVRQGIADPDRLGIGGWSYGGFMSSWAVTQTGRFKAAIVGAAVTDLFSMFGTTDIPTFQRAYFLDLPFRRRAAYDGHSPMSFIQNVKTPSLVLHGLADDRVPPGQGWEFYTGLRSLGVETEMVLYPREPHVFVERAHWVDRYRRVLAWFDGHLKGPAR